MTTYYQKPTTLGAATIKAQQALSEKYGIPTFTMSGEVSTVPITRSLSSINVGVGAYRMETPSSFTVNLQNIVDTFKNIGGTLGNTVFQTPSTSKPNPTTPTPNGINPNPTQGPIAPATTGATGAGITDQVIHSLDNIKNFIGPTGLIVGLGLITLLIVTRGK